MNSTEIAIYAVETKAIIQILWGLLLVTAITLVSVSIMYVLLRLKIRSGKRRETQLAKVVAAKAAEITRLEERVAHHASRSSAEDELKVAVARATAIRAKSEQRLVEQNGEIEGLRRTIANQASAMARLEKLVQHVEGV